MNSHLALRALLALASLSGWNAATAQIQAQFQTRSISPAFTNWNQSVQVPRFDPQFGKLLSVGISVTGRAVGAARVESADAVATTGTLTFRATITLTRPDLSIITSATPTAVFNENLGPSDGLLDFGGTSGVSHTGIDVSALGAPTSLVSPSDLSLFTGPLGAPGQVTLPITAVGTSFTTGFGNVTTQFQTSAGAKVEIAYTYDTSSGLRVRQAGTAAVPGRTRDYFVSVRNTASVPFNNLDVLASVDPRTFVLESINQPALVSTSTAAALGLAFWTIPQLLPGETRILTYRATLNSQIPIGATISGGPVWVGTGLLNSWALCATSALQTTPDCACAFGCCVAECGVSPELCLDCRAACQLQGCPDLGLACLRATRDLTVSCFDASAHILARSVDQSIVVGPQDPNEKRAVGPTFVQPNEPILYAVHYENIGTLSAQHVTVTDVLQPTLNANTVQVFSGGTFNPTTRTITWQVSGTELAPGESGSVFFVTEPAPNQPPGSEVRNKATIAFEAQPGLITNEVINRIDGVRPIASMGQLPPTTPSAEFVVNWGGADSVGEIQDYSVFVSENGGDYELFRYNTPQTSATFTGQSGSQYGFFCVARDTAGNIEAIIPQAEAFTVVSALSTSFCAGDGGSATCPCGNSSPVGAASGCLNSLGLGGKLETDGAASISLDTFKLIGSQMPDCPSLYFQGTVAINNGQGVPFGDGVRCAGGTAIRLGIKTNVGGGSRYPDLGDMGLAQRGFVLPGQELTYQCWYRNSTDFCTPSTFNLTSGRRIAWGP